MPTTVVTLPAGAVWWRSTPNPAPAAPPDMPTFMGSPAVAAFYQQNNDSWRTVVCYPA